jgi:hypothetical protein
MSSSAPQQTNGTLSDGSVVPPSEFPHHRRRTIDGSRQVDSKPAPFLGVSNFLQPEASDHSKDGELRGQDATLSPTGRPQKFNPVQSRFESRARVHSMASSIDMKEIAVLREMLHIQSVVPDQQRSMDAVFSGFLDSLREAQVRPPFFVF